MKKGQTTGGAVDLEQEGGWGARRSEAESGWIVSVRDLDAAMGGAFSGCRQHERRLGHRGRLQRGARHRDERTHEYGAIVVLPGNCRTVRSTGGLVLVSTPMGMDDMALVVCGRVLVRVCVYKRSAQGSDLDRQRERYRQSFPHWIIVRDSADRRQGSR